MDQAGLAYIHVIEGETQGPRDAIPGFDFGALKRGFRGLYMANNNFDRALAIEARRTGAADLICFGRPYLANPDLVERLRDDVALAPEAPKETWYGGGAHGYTDFPRRDGTV